MAKLSGPLFSINAHGTVGDMLTFSQRKRVKQVRFQRKQKDRITPARTIQRNYFQATISWWHELSSSEQQEWHEIGLEG